LSGRKLARDGLTGLLRRWTGGTDLLDGLEATSATDGREGLLRWMDLRTAAGWIGRLWKNGSEVCGKLDRELSRDGLRCLMVDLF
jgi:hypothetical protein